MITFYDHATNASCPQQPAWQISPVGYKWAQAVFQNCEKPHPVKAKEGVEAAPKLKRVWENLCAAIIIRGLME